MTKFNELTEKEQSIIYTALIAFHASTVEAVNTARTITNNDALVNLMQWLTDETKALKEKLFPDIEPGSNDPFTYYEKKLKSQQPVTG